MRFYRVAGRCKEIRIRKKGSETVEKKEKKKVRESERERELRILFGGDS